MRIMLKNCRIAFAQGIFTAKAGEDGGTPSYSAAFIFEKGSGAAKVAQKAIAEAAEAKWADKAPATLKALAAQDKICLHSGDTKEYEGFEGNLFVSARSKVAPKVFNSDRTPLTISDGKPYSGCYVNALVEIYAQDNKFGKRVNASLLGVQFVKDGDSFGGSAPAKDDEFDNIEDTGEEGFDSLVG
jgi:hypothetical protein